MVAALRPPIVSSAAPGAARLPDPKGVDKLVPPFRLPLPLGPCCKPRLACTQPRVAKLSAAIQERLGRIRALTRDLELAAEEAEG